MWHAALPILQPWMQTFALDGNTEPFTGSVWIRAVQIRRTITILHFMLMANQEILKMKESFVTDGTVEQMYYVDGLDHAKTS